MKLIKMIVAILTVQMMLVSSVLANASKHDFHVTQIATDLYQHVSYQNVGIWGMVAASGLIYTKDNQAYVVDTPWSDQDSRLLIKWASDKGLSIKAVIVTHFHHDASGGLAAFNENKIPTYATTKTNQVLATNNREQATKTLNTEHSYFANKSLEVYYPGAGHSEDNIVVWLPKEQFLFGGCFVKSQRSRSLGNLGDANVEVWSESINRVSEQFQNILWVMPGHGEIGGAELLSHTKGLVDRKINDQK